MATPPLTDSDATIGRLIRQALRCRNLSDLIQWTASDQRHLCFCQCLINPPSTGRDQHLRNRIDAVCIARKVNRHHLALRFAEVGRVLGLDNQCGGEPGGGDTGTGANAILGLPPGASERQIKTAFRLQAKTLHPDAGSGTSDSQAFRRLCSAYEKALRHVRQDGSSDMRDRTPQRSTSPRQSNAPLGPPSNFSWQAFNWLLIVVGVLGCIAFLADASFRCLLFP